MVSLSEYFGFDPNSPYADLFSKIYYMTKVTPDDEVEQEKEDGEIIETYDFNNIDEQMIVKHGESDHLTGERDFHPPLGGETSSQLAIPPPPENWNKGWMKISKDAISWNQASNQNLVSKSWDNHIKKHLQPPLRPSSSTMGLLPPPPPPSPILNPNLLQGGLGPSQPNSSIFQGTNQINVNIFNTSVGGIPDFSVPPPPLPLQLPSWATNSFSQQGFNLPPPQAVQQTRGEVGNFAADEKGKESIQAKGFDLRIQFDIDNNPVRQTWLLKYMDFQASRGDPLIICPALYKEPLDLFKLFNAVLDEGGFHNCNAKKCWKKIGERMTTNHKQPQLWRLLQKMYRRLLLQFETSEAGGGMPQDMSMTQLGEETGGERQGRPERKALLPLPFQQQGEFFPVSEKEDESGKNKWRKGGKGFKKHT